MGFVQTAKTRLQQIRGFSRESYLGLGPTSSDHGDIVWLNRNREGRYMWNEFRKTAHSLSASVYADALKR